MEINVVTLHKLTEMMPQLKGAIIKAKLVQQSIRVGDVFWPAVYLVEGSTITLKTLKHHRNHHKTFQ